MNEPLLSVSGLSAGYGGVHVLRDIHLQVRPGEIVALAGSNCAGKSTLLKALSRLIPFHGHASFHGHELHPLNAEQVFGLGLVQLPEGRQLFGQMSVQDNLLMGAYRQGSKDAIRQSLDQVYTLFPKLYERRAQMAGSLSGGEQQMCAMGRAMMASPRLLMVDEMSLGLAPVVVDQLLDILMAMRGEGITVLLVEQDVFAALSIADRCYVLENGAVVKEGPARDIADDPDVKRAYLGL